MASNFDFLKDIDKELFELIEEAQRLYRSEYFNQTVIQVRIYAEKMAKKILNPADSTMTFDNILNCLKDRIKEEREREFIDDLFLIKKSGNACAHGEDISAIDALEVIKCAFEAGINYAYFKKVKNINEIDKLRFDEALFVTQKPQKENKIIDKYLTLAQEEIDKKQQCENSTKIKAPNSKKEEFKRKVKEAKKNLAANINKNVKNKTKKTERKPDKKINKKTNKKRKCENINLKKYAAFFIFLIISLILLIKMIF